MQNIQDLKEKIFFESKNIIDILEKINNVDELLSKQDLVDELANRISFLRLLEKNIEFFVTDNSAQTIENGKNISFVGTEFESKETNNDVTEEEAIFNNEFNEIDENELHENIISFVEENSEEQRDENFDERKSQQDITEEEAVFNNQLNEIDENDTSDYEGSILSFVDEERILADSEPETHEDIDEEMFSQETTEEEVIFTNQLNEIDEFENELSDDQDSNSGSFEEEEKIQLSFEPETENANETPEAVERIPSIFDTELLDEEILIEENEEQFITSSISLGQGEMANETSNVENILNEIKNDAQTEEKYEEAITEEEHERRRIVEINKPHSEIEKKKPSSDENFENLDAYNQEKKIKLANIKGLKAVKTLFDDDPLEREVPQEKKETVIKEDMGSLLKTNIPTDFMEAEKRKPEFKLDLNDRIAFSKTLFGGSQSELNEVITDLNSFRTLEEAKEYLSDLYYARNWGKVDEYAQRLWVLVENKFL
ncbi:hypothetical protein [Chryseobacterium populi]|uniref:Uncharacterized protein n=1 Tax=Chryseobacterium populi TaxID=1144316 RepID=J3CNP2_9FLAO|nr:hypothetical protein [Chryseobacterium populi]EJL75151.1 hypothetical protein PMI13_00628 [Chryseobacterium populi]